MSADADEAAATEALLAAIQKLEKAFGLIGAGMETLGAVMERFDDRLTRLEAAVVIQTGTVFGAQGDSEPMTIEHTIPEPPLNEWKA